MNASATTVSYTTDQDVFIEWSKTDGGYANRNTKGYLKDQYSLDANGNQSSVCKSYIKFTIPSDVGSLNSVVFHLTNIDVGDVTTNQVGLEIWALPNGYDGWLENTLTWNTATSTYLNDPSGQYFTQGTQVFSGLINGGKAVTTDITLFADRLMNFVSADTDHLITLVLCANSTVGRFCDSENATASHRPSITWNYNVPEPVTASLLALGAMAFIRRRRT